MTRTTPAATGASLPPELLRSGARRTGIDVVGDAPWGTHFCQFYATKDDLTDVLVPYFKAGLDADEFCMWVTSPPLGVEEAWSALARAVPDLDSYRRRGRIEIVPHTEWYLLGGSFDQERVLRGWVTKHDDALARGCTGLRLTGNTFWLEKADWRGFVEYEAAVDGVLGQYRMLALCTYSLERCGASEVADVIRNHQFALMKREGRWEQLESFDRRRMQDALAAERERLEVTLQSIGDAVIATDTAGRITTLNRVAEELTGWPQAEASGRPIGEVFRIVSERTGAQEEDPVRKVLELGTIVGVADQVALMTRDGRRISIADSAAPIRGRGGATLGVVLVFRDITAERRTQEALQRSDTLLRAITDSSPDPIFVKDRNSRMLLANGATLAVIGKPAEEVIGKTDVEVYADANVGRTMMENDRRVMDSGRTEVVEEIIPFPAGPRVFLSTKSPYRDAEGRVVGVVGVARDITERKKAQDALRESEQRVRLKLESILSPQGDIGDLELADIVDAQALQALMDELYKLTRVPMAVIDVEGKVLVGVGWQDICTKFHRVHPETCKYCIESDTQLTAGVPEGESRLYKCKNNMWDLATPLTVGGHHIGNVFMGQFFFDDERLDYELFEAQAKRYGFDPAEYLAALEAVPRLSRETVAVGMAFFLRLSAMLSRLSYSNVNLARSIAERESLMGSLRESKERLEEVDRRKDEFLGMLSHELRNPLAPIRNSIYVLNHADPTGERARRAKDVIERQSEQLTRLVDDLLDVTRIARGKIELRRGRVDLAQLVRRAGEDHGGLMRERGIELVVDAPREPMWVDGDAVRLAQAVGNLLQNSAKFTPSGGRVTLALETVREAAEIHVRDTGAGMEPALLNHVFEPFVQAERTLARTSGGLGLGLALVKGLTEMHGGSVRAASAGPGQGSEFVVRLPLAEKATAVRTAVARPSSGGTSRRVLVVDDNKDAAESLAELVEMFGHTVDVVYDGPSAIAAARANPPDVILCDIGLPGMSGYDVARALRAESNGCMQLVAVSGYAQPEDLRRAAEAGFDRHVAKPPDPDDIARLLA